MTYLLRLAACLFLFVSLNSFGALYDRGNGLIYDDVLDITWLQDANYAQTSGHDADGMMTWSEANSWAAQLEYAGYDDWRLASAGNPPSTGYNVTTGELGHMFYNNLGNTAGTSILNNVSFTDATLGGGTVSFVNVQDFVYWLDEEYLSDKAFAFRTDIGAQNRNLQNSSRYSWAVRAGDSSPIPVPAATWLFGSALLGLGLVRRK